MFCYGSRPRSGANILVSWGVLLVALILLSVAEADTQWTAMRRNVIEQTCFGGGKFVAVGRYNNIRWSSDGIHWWGAKTDLADAAYLYGVCWGGGQFVAVGHKGKILRSEDGKVWTSVVSPTNEHLYSVAWADGKFVAVGDEASVFSSTDGLNWSELLYTDDGQRRIDSLRAVSFGNGIWAAADEGNTYGIYSSDGENWTTMYLGAGNSQRMIYAGGYFSIVGDGSAAASVLRSSDGQNWSIFSAPEDLAGIAYNPENATWVAVAEAGALYRSTNLSSWTQVGTTEEGSSISFGNGLFSTIGRERIATSADGTNWTVRITSEGTSLDGVCWHQDRFVVAGDSGFVGHFNEETGELTAGTSPLGEDWFLAASDGVSCVAMSLNGAIIRSSDGLTWTDVTPGPPRAKFGLDYVMGKFCAVGYSGSVFVSSDGSAWQFHQTGDTGSTGDLFAVASDGTVALAIGRNSAVYRSTNLATWGDSPKTPFRCTDIAFGNGVFVAIGSHEVVYVSSNRGATWSTVPLYDGALGHIIFENGQFVLASDNREGRLFTSVDGLSWEEQATGLEEYGWFGQVAFGGGRYVIASEYGGHLVSERLFKSSAELGQLQIEPGESGGSFALSLPAAAAVGGLFCIERSSDLSVWEVISGDLTPAAGGFLYEGTADPATRSSFFRVRWDD